MRSARATTRCSRGSSCCCRCASSFRTSSRTSCTASSTRGLRHDDRYDRSRSVPGTAIRPSRLRGLRETVGRFIARTDGLAGAVILAVFTVLALVPELFVGPLETVVSATGASLEPPSAAHLLGTDELGRDMLNLTVHGARISMTIGLLATIITILVGAVIGIVAGYVGGPLDIGLMRVTDFFLVLPTYVLAIILAPILLDIIGAEAEILGIRATLLVIVVVIGLTSWATTSRVIRSQVLSVKERMFV